MAGATRRALVVGLGTAIVPLDTALNIALPDISHRLATPVGEMQWVVIAYVATYATLILAFGRVGDLFGHGVVFRAGLAWSAVALLLCALAPSYPWLLAGRVGQGIGSALVLSCGPALLTALYHDSARAQALGLYTMMVAIGGALGPIIGGMLVDRFGWPAIFWFRAPIALAALALLAGPLPAAASAASRRTFDFAVAFRRVDFALINGASMCVNLANFVVLLVAPYYLAGSIHLSAAAGGLVLAIGAAGTIAGSPLGARLVRRTGAGGAAIWGMGLSGAGLGLVGLLDLGPGPGMLATLLLLQGFGLGLFQVAYMEMVVAALPVGDRGVAGSLTMLTRTLGVVSGAQVLTLGFQHFRDRALAQGAEAGAAIASGFQASFLGAGALVGLTVLLLLVSRVARRG